MPNPGSIQMKKGRWRIYTAMQGFRPQWMALDIGFICDRIRQWQGASHNPLMIARSNKWIAQLKAAQTSEEKKLVIKDMRYVATKSPETRWQKCVAEWAGWLNYLIMVRFAEPEKKAA